MKKIIVLLMISLCVTALIAQDTVWDKDLMGFSPESTGAGRSDTAISSGVNSLYANPAGLAVDDFEFLVAVSGNLFSPVNPATIDLVNQVISGQISTIEELIAAAGDEDTLTQMIVNGVGINTRADIGFVLNGFGVDTYVLGDTFFRGNNLMGITGDVYLEYGLSAGYGMEFDIVGMKLDVGMTLHPFYRFKVPEVSLVSLLQMAEAGNTDPLNSYEGKGGFGIGIDAGATLELGDFTVAIAVRDIAGTKIGYTEMTVESFYTQLSELNLIPSGTAADAETVPMSIKLGGAFHLDLGSLASIIDPTFHADYDYQLGDDVFAWRNLHIGAEAKIIDMIFARAGLNQGYLTAGVGAQVWIFDIDASIYTNEMGDYAGASPSTGMNLSVGLKF